MLCFDEADMMMMVLSSLSCFYPVHLIGDVFEAVALWVDLLLWLRFIGNT